MVLLKFEGVKTSVLPSNSSETTSTIFSCFGAHVPAFFGHVSCMHFHFRSMRISFISKITRVHKAMTVANDTSLCSTILVVFLTEKTVKFHNASRPQ